MTQYGTIKIPQDAYNRHNEHRKDLGLTWEEYINNEAPEFVDVDDLRAVAATPEDLTALRQDILSELAGDIEESLNTASMASDPTVDVDGEQITKTLEKVLDLVDRVPERTAEQVEDRFK